MNVLYKASTMRDWLIKGGIYARKSMGEPCVVKKSPNYASLFSLLYELCLPQFFSKMSMQPNNPRLAH